MALIKHVGKNKISIEKYGYFTIWQEDKEGNIVTFMATEEEFNEYVEEIEEEANLLYGALIELQIQDKKEWERKEKNMWAEIKYLREELERLEGILDKNKIDYGAGEQE